MKIEEDDGFSDFYLPGRRLGHRAVPPLKADERLVAETRVADDPGLSSVQSLHKAARIATI